MKGRTLRWAAGIALVVGLSSASAAVDEDFMRYLEDVFKSGDNHIALKDLDGATKDAKELAELFAEVEAHYVKEADEKDGLKLARQANELSNNLVKVLVANDFGSAASLSIEIAINCKSCHNIYK